MPAYNQPITIGQYSLLRSNHYEGSQQFSLFSDRVTFAGQINQNTIAGQTWAQLAYHNVTVGTYNSGDFIAPGQTIFISHTNNIAQSYFQGRIRLLPDATNLYINESSNVITTGDYFFVVDRWECLDRLSRPVGTLPSVVQYIDFDRPFQLMQPSVYGLQTVYVGNADPTSGKLRIAFSVTGKGMETGSTISSYLFAFRSGIATVVSGSLSSATVTVDLDPTACTAWGETWGLLTVTDSNGVTLQRVFGIKIHNAAHPPTLSTENIQIRTNTDKGYSATVPAFADVNSVLPQALGVVWRSNEVYGSTPGLLGASNNVDFVGWLRKDQPTAQGDKDYSVTEDTKFEFIGPGGRLAMLEMQALALINSTTANPGVWDHLYYATPAKMVWHVLSRHSTYAMLCDVSFDSDLASDQYTIPADNTQGRNIQNACKQILDQVNAQIDFNPDGSSFIYRRIPFQTSTQRAALTPTANFNSTDGTVVSVMHTYEPTVGKVDGDGAVTNAFASQTVTAFRSRSPGLAQGLSQGTNTLSAQILASTADNNAAQSELNQRTGNQYNYLNLQETLTIDHLDGYNFIVPSQGQVYTWTLSGLTLNGVDRIDYTTAVLWMVDSVNFTHDNEKGTRKIQIVYRRLSDIGDPGTTIPIPPPSNISIPPLPPLPFPNLPDLPPFPDLGVPTLPTGPIPLTNGGLVIITTATHCWVAKNFTTLTTPIWNDVTPSGMGNFQITQAIFDPIGPITASYGAYILANDGTQSAVWYAPNVTASRPTWTKGANITNVFTTIRGTENAGTILIAGPSAGTGNGISFFDFSISDYGFADAGCGGGMTYVSGQGFLSTTTGSSGGHTFWLFLMQKTVQNHAFIPRIKIEYTTGVTPPGIGGSITSPSQGQSCHGTYTVASPPAGTDQIMDSYPTFPYPNPSPWEVFPGDGWGFEGRGPDDIVTSASQILIQKIWVYYTNAGSAPWSTSGGTGVGVAQSTTYGSTWGSVINVADQLSCPVGFDVQSAGGVSYCGGPGVIYKSTGGLGSSYSAWFTVPSGDPCCIIIPYFKWGSTTNNQTASSTPDVLVGTTTGKLYKVDGATAVSTDITPPGGGIFNSNNAVTISYGTVLAAYTNNGAYHLYRSKDTAATWQTVETLTSPAFIRGRRRDGTALQKRGQLYVINGASVDYSSHWAQSSTPTMYPRHTPSSALLSVDIWN